MAIRPFRVLTTLILLISILVGVVQAQPDSISAVPHLEPGTERHTKAKSGRRLGLIVGGVAGAGLFVLGGAAQEAFCEYDCGDITPLGYVGLGAIGFGVGALTGALLGTLIGSMIPDNADSSPTGTAPSHEVSRPFIASVAVEPGWGVLTERPENESGFTVRSTLLAQLGSWIGVGPEITYGDLAGGMFGFGGAVVLGPRDTGLRPYAVTNFGFQQWQTGIIDTDVGVVALGVGAGLSWTPGSGKTHLGIESRYHWSPQHIDHNEAYSFVNTSVSLRHSW